MLTIPAHPNPRCLVWGSLGTNRKNINGLSWPLKHAFSRSIHQNPNMVPICLLLFLHASTNFLQLWIFFWQRHSETSLILAAVWQGMTWDYLAQKRLHSICPSFFIFTFPYHQMHLWILPLRCAQGSPHPMSDPERGSTNSRINLLKHKSPNCLPPCFCPAQKSDHWCKDGIPGATPNLNHFC